MSHIDMWRAALQEAMREGRKFALINPINGDRLFFD